jgi:hypothetical protein
VSQATQSLTIRRQLSAHRIIALSALLALLVTAAVVLVPTIDAGSTRTSAPAAQTTHPRVLWNGRPDGTRAVGSVSSRPSPSPDESSIAATIASGAAPKGTGDDAQSRRWAEYQAKIRSMTPAQRAGAFGGDR